MEKRKLVTKNDIIRGLREAGLQEGDKVMVHCSLSSMGFVCGGAQAVLEALLEVVTEKGTILMPTQSWKNMDPEAGVHWEEPKEWWQAIRENWPAYDKNMTPTNTMGAVAELFRTIPGAYRSDHPVRSVTAWGASAEYFVADHDLEDIFGEASPIGKLYQEHGKVLLMGVDYDKNTSLHLADVRGNYPGKTTETVHCAMKVNGERRWISYETLLVDGEDFIDIGRDYEKDHTVGMATVGDATFRLMDQRELVDFATDWVSKNRM